MTNLGMFDVEDFGAIINPPEAAILAVGTIKEQPVVVDGQIGIGHRMKVTLSVRSSRCRWGHGRTVLTNRQAAARATLDADAVTPTTQRYSPWHAYCKS